MKKDLAKLMLKEIFNSQKGLGAKKNVKI